FDESLIQFGSGLNNDPLTYMNFSRLPSGEVQAFYTSTANSLSGDAFATSPVPDVTTDNNATDNGPNNGLPASRRSEFYRVAVRFDGTPGTSDTVTLETAQAQEHTAYWVTDTSGAVLSSSSSAAGQASGFVFTSVNAGGAGNNLVIPLTFPADGTVFVNIAMLDATLAHGPYTFASGFTCPSPALDLDKTLTANADNDGSGTVTVGDILTYTITATNSFGPAQTNVVVSDPLLDAPNTMTCPTVASGGTCVLTGTHTVTAPEVNAGMVDNTASAQSTEVTMPVTASISTPAVVNPIDAMDDDFTSTPIPAVGGNTPTVFSDDTINSLPFAPADVIATIVDPNGLTGVSINADGILTVPAGTPANTYPVVYQICEAANPSNCATATSTVVVEAGAIDAMDDDFTSTPASSSTGGVTPSVFSDDTLNTVAVDPADLTTTLTDNGGLTGAVLNSDGTITIPPGTPADTYTLTYEICEILNPANCDTAMVMVLVEAPAIDAMDDDFTTLPISGGEGTPSLFGADTMDGQSFNSEDVALTIINDAGLTGVTSNADGTLNIPVGTPAGTFGIEYQICDVINPANCDIAVATIVIANPVNLFATKTATTATATTGSVVVYTITVRNDDAAAATGIEIVDTPPLGFRFVEGSGRLNGASVEPVLRNRELVWSGVDIAPGETATVNLGLIVGAGVSVGDFVNTAFAETGPGTVLLSNEAQAIVRISPDEIFDCSELIGKVYEDLDGDGYQDEGERGLPGVRIATVNGLLITTDEYGRYHIACAATPKQGIGSNFIVKLDERSLPTGFSVTSENPRVIRLTEGKLSSADFGVQGLRPMSIDLQPHAFIAGSNDLSPELSSAIAGVLEELRKEPTILTLNYEGEDGRARLDALVNRIRSDWGDGPYNLEIWTNSISGPVGGER
ncbi:MAG: hypothetical protein ABJG15_18990, partial [Hyphomonadaceae bacterium]